MSAFFTIEEVGELLEQAVDSLDPGVFRDLSGGLNLSPHEKLHPRSVADDYYVLGEYVRDGINCYIMIYYGSLKVIYRDLNRDELLEKLQDLIHHELIHHWEYLAGEKDLEIEDRINYEAYLKAHERRN